MPVIKIGADPEGFLVDGNGEFVPAIGIIPGDKKTPFKVQNGAVQVDGVAVEFNIDPAETEEQFSYNMSSVLRQIDDIIKKVDTGLSVRWTPVARFKEEIWNRIPNNSKVLGCDPDYNVNGEVNVNPTEALEGSTLRTAAGHIHIGFRDELLKNPMEMDHFSDCLYIAQGFFNGHVPAYIPKTEDEVLRMRYYGHHGSFRPKPYGVELRAPSNWYVADEKGRKAIFNQTRTKFRELTGL